MHKALGDLALREVIWGGAAALCRGALAIYPDIGARLGEANVQKALGDLALREADLGEARRRYAAALAIYPDIGARLGEANVQKALGDLALREDDLGEARALCRGAGDLSRHRRPAGRSERASGVGRSGAARG
ncbi:MAG: hypothetical protein IPM07_07470 [Anaerolineales bacterium]|nr:hypothetical protein [Anaerolineales bacterium]